MRQASGEDEGSSESRAPKEPARRRAPARALWGEGGCWRRPPAAGASHSNAPPRDRRRDRPRPALDEQRRSSSARLQTSTPFSPPRAALSFRLLLLFFPLPTRSLNAPTPPFLPRPFSSLVAFFSARPARPRSTATSPTSTRPLSRGLRAPPPWNLRRSAAPPRGPFTPSPPLPPPAFFSLPPCPSPLPPARGTLCRTLALSRAALLLPLFRPPQTRARYPPAYPPLSRSPTPSLPSRVLTRQSGPRRGRAALGAPRGDHAHEDSSAPPSRAAREPYRVPLARDANGPSRARSRRVPRSRSIPPRRRPQALGSRAGDPSPPVPPPRPLPGPRPPLPLV